MNFIKKNYAYIPDAAGPGFTHLLDKINQVGEVLRKNYLSRTEYDDPQYLQLLKKYKNDNLEIPLSEYLK